MSSASSTTAGFRSSSEYVLIPAASGAAPNSAVIFIHGLGDSGYGWAPLSEEWKRAFPTTQFIFPNAPKRPVTLNGGMKMPSWHDIKDLDTLDTNDFVGLLESKATIDALIQKAVDGGIPANKIILGGFSQGAAMSLITGIQSAHSLAGIVSLSGYLPYDTKSDVKSIANAANTTTQIFMGHGTADNVVQYKYGENACKRLQAAGYSVSWNTYSGMAHSSCAQELKDVITFFKKVLSLS